MKVIAQNKKAVFDYEILQEYEAGVALLGKEVKSLRTQKPNLKGAFISVLDGNLYLKNMHVPRYKPDGSGNHEPTRDRKLLLHKKEIEQISTKLNETGTTVVPISIYLKNNLIKLKIAVARGKKKHDKRESLKKKDQDRQMKRAIKNYR